MTWGHYYIFCEYNQLYRVVRYNVRCAHIKRGPCEPGRRARGIFQQENIRALDFMCAHLTLQWHINTKKCAVLSYPQLINIFPGFPQVCKTVNRYILIAMNDYSKMWQTALIEIENDVSQANFSTWFKETKILRETEGVVYLGVPNSFTQEWLYKKHH